MVIFDLNGQFKKKVWVPFYDLSTTDPCPVAINNQRIYQLVENEDEEEWELHINIIKY